MLELWRVLPSSGLALCLIVSCDASDKAVGCVLKQSDATGFWWKETQEVLMQLFNYRKEIP